MANSLLDHIDLDENEKETHLSVEDHWTDMPEFVQEKQRPFCQLIVRFESEEDLKDFANRIEQKLTPKTKSIWHPFKSHYRKVIKEWFDES